MIDIPPEFSHLADDPEIPWRTIITEANKRLTKSKNEFVAFTDAVIEIASKESLKKTPRKALIALGVEAALTRGRIADALFLSSDVEDVRTLSLRAIALFVLADIVGLQKVLSHIEKIVTDSSPIEDRVRRSTTKVLLSAAEQDTSVIICIMEFDNLLENYPEQVETPLTETLFTLYVVGTMLKEVGEAKRATRIADTLETMALAKNHRMILALVENLRGNICHLTGDHKGAEEHYLQFKKLSEELSFQLGIGMALNNLGSLKLWSLQLEEAMEYLNAAVEHLDLEAARQIAVTNLGELATLLGRFEEAEKWFKEAIRLEKKTQKGILEVFTFYSILLVRLGRIEDAKKYLKKAERIARRSEKPLQQCAFLHADAFFAAATDDFERAVSLLETELDLARKKGLFEMIIKAELELARTHMLAFEKTQEPERISKAISRLDDLAQISKEQGLQSLHAHALLLKSDLARLVNRSFEARGYLERVLSIAKFTEDTTLEEAVMKRLDLLEHTSAVTETTDVGRTIDRISAFRTLGVLKAPPTPSLHAIIVIHRASGLTEFVHYFDSSLQMDSSIVAGFISAIITFSSQLMGSPGSLRSISHEGFTVMMEHTRYRTYALIATQESFELRYRLRKFQKEFEQKFKPQFDQQGVRTSEYEGASKIIKNVFAQAEENKQAVF